MHVNPFAIKIHWYLEHYQNASNWVWNLLGQRNHALRFHSNQIPEKEIPDIKKQRELADLHKLKNNFQAGHFLPKNWSCSPFVPKKTFYNNPYFLRNHTSIGFRYGITNLTTVYHLSFDQLRSVRVENGHYLGKNSF